MKLTVRKTDPGDVSRCRFDEVRSLHAWTAYDVEVVAEDFRLDQTSSCILQIFEGNDVLAQCTLEYDGLRRDRRGGVLVFGDTAHATLVQSKIGTERCMLRVVMGTSNDVVLYAQVPVFIGPKLVIENSGSGSSTAAEWTEIAGGTITQLNTSETTLSGGKRALAITLPEHSMKTVTLDLRTLPSGLDVVIVPTKDNNVVSTGVYEAYLEVKTLENANCTGAKSWASAGKTGFSAPVLGEILIGSVAPTTAAGTYDPCNAVRWTYEDAKEVVSPNGAFVIKVTRRPFQDAWTAEFRANAASHGVEVDPEGKLMPGVDTNERED